MPFVGDPFRHDVFVSYSHGDVQGDGASPLKQWSQSFVQELRRELQFEINAAIDIFIDESARPGQGVDRMAPLSDDLNTKIGAAAILLVLMSPQYLGSVWCGKELDWWVAAQADTGIAHATRIAVARVLPTGDAEWPKLLTDDAGNPYVGTHFFDRATEVGARPFGWPIVTSATAGPFRDAAVAFAGTIQARLREIQRELELRRKRVEEIARLKAGTGQAIYLHGRESQQDVWQRVRTELIDFGYGVFPLKPEPVDIEPKKIRERAARRIGIMQSCDAVLLLGTDDSEALEGDLPSIGRFDRGLAIENSNRLLPCSVVDTAGLVGRDPALKRIAANLRVDWIDATIPQWTPRVQAWLREATQ